MKPLQEGMGAIFKYAMLITSQQISSVEQKVAMLYNKVQAMLKEVKISFFIIYGQWAETVPMAKFLENNLIKKSRDLSPFQQFFVKQKKHLEFVA